MLRYALQATADININQLNIALLNYIVSKNSNDSFLIRVEDIDKNSTIEEKEQESIDILKKFSIKADQTTYQSEKLKTYQKFAKKLLEDGKAYVCICQEESSCKCINLTQKDIQESIKSNQEYRLRIQEPKSTISFQDLVQGEVTTTPKDIGSFTILNSKGEATQNFANAIDDMLENVITIVDLDSNIENTLKQIYIQKLLNYNPNIKYIHIESIDINNTPIKTLFKDGFLPDAIINYLLSLQFNTPKPIFYLPEAIEWLDIYKISKNSAKFNIEELKYINREHLLLMDSKKLSSIFGFADKDIGELLKLYLKDISTINELESIFNSIFGKKECNQELKELSSIILKAPMIKSFKEFEEYLKKKSSIKEDRLHNALKLLLTGSKSGPKVEDVFPLIKSYILEVAQCQ